MEPHMHKTQATKPAHNTINSVVRCLFFSFLCLLPAVLFFSYYPIISFGSNSSMNFELSLPLIWLVLFDIIAFVALLNYRFSRSSRPAATSKAAVLPGLSDRRFFLLSLFPFFATISIFWSANPLRGILTAGIIWLLFFAIFAIVYVTPLLRPPANLKPRLLAVFFISTIIICLFCFLQSILDVCGVPRTDTLLCAGCTYRSFGFPHPSGFAIEPQFMGNLLLAPTLLGLYLLTFNQLSKKGNNKSKIQLSLFAFLASLALFFTFSRGAIYAYAVALFVLFIFALKTNCQLAKPHQPSSRPASISYLIAIPVASFLGSLCLQGAFAALGPTSETFSSAITKSIHHLSLGIIDLRSPQVAAPSTPETPEVSGGESVDANLPEDTSFDGYVAESTNIRLDLNAAAVNTWLSAPGHPPSSLTVSLNCQKFCCPCTGSGPLTPTSVLFGVGLGSAGTALVRNSFITGITSPKEIVQNQYFSLLLELGLIGIGLSVLTLLIIFFPRLFPPKFLDGRAASTVDNAFWRHPALPLLLSLIIAYLITLNFFSGLPNALHIYLLPPLLYILYRSKSSRNHF